jgi:carboxylesterase
MQGGEPFYFRGNRTGCLLLHGFTATPQEMRGLGEHLAGEGFSVLGVRLFGHATDIRDMLRARWTDWLASVEDGYRLLSGSTDRVVVMGLSLGGALALLFAASTPVSGVVAMSTPYALPADPRLRLVRLSRGIVRFAPKGPPDYRDPQAAIDRRDYKAYPLPAMKELEATLAALRAALPRVTAPLLLIHSKEDDFVTPDNATAIYQHVGSSDKATMLVENSNHVITLDAARQQVFEAAAAFAKRVGAGAA